MAEAFVDLNGPAVPLLRVLGAGRESDHAADGVGWEGAAFGPADGALELPATGVRLEWRHGRGRRAGSEGCGRVCSHDKVERPHFPAAMLAVVVDEWLSKSGLLTVSWDTAGRSSHAIGPSGPLQSRASQAANEGQGKCAPT